MSTNHQPSLTLTWRSGCESKQPLGTTLAERFKGEWSDRPRELLSVIGQGPFGAQCTTSNSSLPWAAELHLISNVRRSRSYTTLEERELSHSPRVLLANCRAHVKSVHPWDLDPQNWTDPSPMDAHNNQKDDILISSPILHITYEARLPSTALDGPFELRAQPKPNTTYNCNQSYATPSPVVPLFAVTMSLCWRSSAHRHRRTDVQQIPQSVPEGPAPTVHRLIGCVRTATRILWVSQRGSRLATWSFSPTPRDAE